MIHRFANTLKAALNIPQHRLVKLQPLCQAAAKALLRQGFSSSVTPQVRLCKVLAL